MPRFQLARCALSACLLLGLTACVTTANLSTATVASYRDTLDLTGRLLVNSQKNGQPESLTGKFSWNQSPAAIDVSMFGPLGQTVAKIKVTPSAADTLSSNV